jgi:rare lipoprotein A
MAARAFLTLSSLVLLSGCAVFGYPSHTPPAYAGGTGRVIAAEAPAPSRAPTTASRTSGSSEDRRSEGSGFSPISANLPPAASGPSGGVLSNRSYEIFGQRYWIMSSALGYSEIGLASWYGDEFKGKPTSTGEIFDPNLMTAAHRSLPLRTWVEVTNLSNGSKVVVRVNDRGPFADPHLRIIDLSREAAKRLGFAEIGLARVEIRAIPADSVPGMLLEPTSGSADSIPLAPPPGTPR